jgi:hypothetical protein
MGHFTPRSPRLIPPMEGNREGIPDTDLLCDLGVLGG